MKTELYKKLNQSEIEAFGQEMEALRLEIQAKLGQTDADYIEAIYRKTRYYEILGRFFIHFSVEPLAWLSGVGFLSLAKIINNMELGHNVMHGQYDWMNHPELNSRDFDWEHVSDNEQWKFSHNYMHHTYTNIVGRDHDFGYNLLRLSTDQQWHPLNLPQTIYTVVQALLFDFGIGSHGTTVEYAELDPAQKTNAQRRAIGMRFLKKITSQTWKDYLLFPMLGGLSAPKIALGNFFANLVRNIWTHSVIVCGHFTEHVETFTTTEAENEGIGGFYLRQLKGSSNLSGSERFYMLTGHLSHQIEHHMFPDIPANRYEEMAPRVQAICEKYGQFYNTGGFWEQYASVWKRILAYSFPDPIARQIMPAA
ncbi:MAG: acyl-CoA desaturase [Leptospiraceae bacterium]|nr:acyl-CoA desaturase [Leptospiraceae bacterium]